MKDLRHNIHEDPPQRQPALHLCSQERIAGVLATLFKLEKAPHRVHRRTGPGFLPNCICRIESTIFSDIGPSDNTFSVFNFRH